MTLVRRGNPEKLRNARRERIRNTEPEFVESPEYAEGNAPRTRYGMGNTKLRKSVNEQTEYNRDENQAIPEPKIVTKRQRVSLTQFPEETSRRKTEGSFIRQMNIREGNYDNTRHRVPTRHLVKARHTKRRNAPYRNSGYYPVDSTRVLRNRRKWLLPTSRLDFREGVQNEVVDDTEGDGAMAEQFGQCCRTGQAENAAPQTYMVEVEPSEDGDVAGTASVAQPQLPLCNKYYYVFEKKPFKVKFLNFVSSPGKDCISPVMRSPLKLSMPAFLCKPPECREVLYCKYFQCTSLGFFPDSRNCRKYFFCDLNSNGFVLYHMLCPRGRIFDPCIRECRLKETMDKREAERCLMETAKLKRGGKARIKKNESVSQDLIKYKERGENEKVENPNKVRMNSTTYDSENINSRHNPKHMKNKKPNQTNDKMTTVPVFTCPPFSCPTQLIPIPILPTLPKYCETASLPTSTTPYPATAPTMLQKPQPQPQSLSQPPTPRPPQTSPLPPPPPTTTISVTPPPTLPPTTPSTVIATHIPTTSPSPPTTQAITPPVQIQKATLPICPPPPKRKKITCPPSKSLEEYYMGDLDSDDYQDDMLEDEYSDDYYDTPDTDDADGQEPDYDWLKQGLDEYLDMLKLKKEEKTEADTLEPETYSEQSTPSLLNDYTYNTGKLDRSEFLQSDTDRGKRSGEKTENATVVDAKENSSELPDFEKCYNDKKVMNLDGYPCKQYGRYPDRYDSTRYYECGAQPDGNMKIEHKRCPKGEEFSPDYLECVATEYLRVTHRKKRVPEVKKPYKQRPTPEPEYNYEDDKEIPNEWLDASHGNKVPNEFKSKTKQTLRIFHLYCKRNSTESPRRQKRNRGHGRKKQRHDVRSFIVKHKKKEEQLDDDDDEDEEYEDDEEDYYDLAEDGKNERFTQGVSDSSSVTTSSSKVLLDADIRVDKQFENDLKSILGKRDEPEPKKDSILITLSGNKHVERSKRNFIKDLFSKKSNGDDPEKEGVVSMLTLINGLPSEYERNALLQKLERRKMMNSHMYRNRQRTLKKKANSDLNFESNTNGFDY